MKKLIIILGPTSTGKTDLALVLAKEFNGELVSCDSRQVYKRLDIGTGKLPTAEVEIKRGEGFWEMDGIKVWMYDVIDPESQYTVYDYVKDARRVIDNIIDRNKLPIIVGGTGLYLKALLEGLPNLQIKIDPKLRKKLEEVSLEELQKKLQKISFQKWDGMNYSDRQNPRRLIRTIEIAMHKVNIKDDTNTTAVGLMSQANILKIGLTLPREILYKRIDKRVVDRINAGMIDEASKLQKIGISLQRMKQLGLEYGILADYLEGKITSVDELIKVMQGKIHGYARRQITWYKKEKNVNWFDITEMNKFFPSEMNKFFLAEMNKFFLAEIEKTVYEWYYKD